MELTVASRHVIGRSLQFEEPQLGAMRHDGRQHANGLRLPFGRLRKELWCLQQFVARHGVRSDFFLLLTARQQAHAHEQQTARSACNNRRISG